MRKKRVNKIYKRKISLRAKRNVLEHLKRIGLNPKRQSLNGQFASKVRIRRLHSEQRSSRAAQELEFLKQKTYPLLDWFASGHEVIPEKIEPKLIQVETGSVTGDLFRLATFLWSVPVSKGFGRRLRFLVLDANNNKLMGLFALGDPVFNLNVRDKWIGWNVRDREQRLVNVMDAYVLGAVPPYADLLAGKLMASLVASAEVSKHFEEKYGEKKGLISGKKKFARLALVTTTSSLGRSSIYNRLKIPKMLEFHRIGITSGYGHFHVSDSVFEQLRHVLELEGHKYASGNRYGDGPNWRFRVVREALQEIGLDPELLRHGVRREVYAVPLAENCKEFLRGEARQAILKRPSVAEISDYWLERWLLPRSIRMPNYQTWTRKDLLSRLSSNLGLRKKLLIPKKTN